MKKLLLVFVIVISVFFLSFYYLSNNEHGKVNGTRDIVLQFITYNGYGNNLYIDNVLTGTQKNNDIAVTSFLNIPFDTTYSTSLSGTDTISPVVTVSNIGRNTVPDSIQIFLSIEPGNYFDTAYLPPLTTGQSIEKTFKKFSYSIGTAYYLKAYTSYINDSNRINDTLNQFSIYLPGYRRNVLYEEFTSDSSPASANNNSFLDNFVNSNFQTVTAIKYHTGLLGNDTFYIANPEQSDARRRYYFVSAVPTTLVDGKLTVSIPYGDSTNLYSPYFKRRSKGTPVSMSVSDQRINGDSIRSTINVNIVSPVPAGDYRLRIMAVERYVYDSLQGYFGQVDFYDIFRAAYPDTNGISISAGVGNYQYQLTYYRQPGWVDSMIYTAAFIQNDYTREVLNCAKGRDSVLWKTSVSGVINYDKADLLEVDYDFKNNYQKFLIDTVQTFLNVELFEALFPPPGWKIYNQDGYITFQQFTGANGPSIGGTKSALMAFYDYNIIGQRDSMYSKVYSNLLSLDTLRFDYAYAQYNSFNIDSLIVKVSSDGGVTFPFEIFRRGGLQLSTAPQTTSFFIPTNNTQWRTFKTSLSNIVSINNFTNIIPSKFSLSQNYPNPFNPKTIINYELPVKSFVKLRLFDLLGREVRKLVDEQQNSGTYHIDFDGSNLSSGIYFYQIITEGFADTKRMVLIK